MRPFDLAIAVMLGAVLLAAVARRLRAPYPVLLALGGLALAFVPGVPAIVVDPNLVLAIFVAPVLMEAAYNSSLRDLQDNWRPVGTLVFVAVGVTVVAVALVAHALVPAMPWAAAVALGAIVAPPDAAAATTILRAVRPPHRVTVILEGESLFNDASALLIYRFAVAAAVTGSFSLAYVAPRAVAVLAGSIAAGFLAARLYHLTLARITEVASTIVLQFVSVFGVWLIADRLGLSGIVAIVVFGITLARLNPLHSEARHRTSATPVWRTAVFVLNALAFTLIGVQVRPILAHFSADQRGEAFVVAGAVVVTVILARIAWIMGYNQAMQLKNRLFGTNLPRDGMAAPTTKTGLLVSWAGMRGIVTVAAALALPPKFPARDLIVFTAFAVALATLVVNGLTLRPLIARLKLPRDTTVEHEIGHARAEGLKRALDELEGEPGASAKALRAEYRTALGLTDSSPGDRPDTRINALRRKAIAAARERTVELRDVHEIGDDAFRHLQEEYDLAELAARDPDAVDDDEAVEEGETA